MAIPSALLKKISDEVIKLINKGMSAEDAIKKVWVLYKIPNVLYEQVRAEGIATVAKELGFVAGDTANGAKAWETIVNTDGVVKDQVKKASARARLDLKEGIARILKQGKAVRVAAVDLQESAPSNIVDLRKEIKKIAEFGGSEKELASLKRKVTSGLKGKELRSAYRGVVNAVSKGTQKQIEKQVEIATIQKTRSNMERVVRTEQARAKAEADRENIANENVKFVKFVLAGGHEKDQCDAYAKADMGYGPGVYPIDKAPVLPIHPNGRSVLVPVYVPKKKGDVVEPEMALQSQADKLGVTIYGGMKLEAIRKRL